jgi:peptidoglycan/LPS O-acetylase OafA/YrhL
MNTAEHLLIDADARYSSTSLLEPPQPSGDKESLRRECDLPPKPRNARYESLTLWRGVACMTLVLYHAGFYADHTWRLRDQSTWTLGGLAISCLDRMAVGVPIFFVVSGYCIAANIDSLRRRPHSLSQYFWRRFRRIYPPLWASYVLGIVVTLAVLIISETAYQECVQLPRFDQFSVWNWIGNITASESWLPHLLDIKPLFLLPNTWTLCYEEQFYAIAGLLLAVASRQFLTAAYVIAVAALVCRVLCGAAGIDIDGFFFDGHWIMFAAGILVYDCLNYFHRFGSRITLGVLSLGVIYGLAERVLCRTLNDRHFGEYIFAASAFSILLILLRNRDAQIMTHWVFKPILWCGKISYSVFLTHYPFVVLVACLLAMIGVRSDGLVLLITVPVCTVLSLPIAWLFHMAVERHFLNVPLEAKTT